MRQVTLTSAIKSDFEALIKDRFGRIVSITRISSTEDVLKYNSRGINSLHHWVIKTRTDTYSLKCICDLSRNEHLVGEIGRLLRLKCISDARLVNIPPSFNSIDRGIAALIRWVPDSRPLGDISREKITKEIRFDKRFLRYFAEIFFLSNAMGISDRHLGNFLYQKRNNRLVMIDNESVGEGLYPGGLYDLVGVITELSPSARKYAMEEISAHLLTMKKRVQKLQAEIRSLVGARHVLNTPVMVFASCKSFLEDMVKNH